MRAYSIISTMLICGFLGACSVTTQTTSGKDWLSGYATAQDAGAPFGDIDTQIRSAGAVEPNLRFPARIGIARLERSGLTPIPADEAARWTDAAGRLGSGFGQFVPISPMVAAMVEQPIVSTGDRPSIARHTIDTIRLAAARQHLDAVLVYEVDGTADAKDTKLSLAEWTLIGALVLPTQDVNAVGVAQAMLIDVRNGYPYGTVQSEATDARFSALIGSDEKGRTLREKVMAEAVAKLTGEAEGMMRTLEPELAALDLRPKR